MPLSLPLEIFVTLFPEGVVDPLTGYAPKLEREYCGLIAYLHARNRVHWEKVKVYRKRNLERAPSADEIFTKHALVIPEYPLSARENSEISVWGSMSADLGVFDTPREAFSLIEVKLVARFTGEGTKPENGQLARQADFLVRSHLTNVGLYVICPERIRETCENALWGTLEYTDKRRALRAGVILLEDIALAIRAVA